MTGGWVGRFLAGFGGRKPADHGPMFEGPPEQPEYYMLCATPTARYADRGPAVYQVADANEEQRLRALRFERYLQQFPEKKGLITEKGEPLAARTARVDPDHVPKFGVFRKKVSLAQATFCDLSVVYGTYCHFVRPAFAAAVEAAAPGLMQFFPYECRLQSGEVFDRLCLMHWTTVSKDPIDAARSGLERTDAGSRNDRLRRGQVVVRRSMLVGAPLQIWGPPIDMVYARPLAESLRGALGKNEQFYPVHVYDDVQAGRATGSRVSLRVKECE